MNEDYLKQFRKQLDADFVAKIHMRLEQKERIQRVGLYITRSALIAAFIFGMLVTFSSPVRADVLGFIEEIAGLRFEVTSDYPGTGEEITIDSEHLSLEEAQNRFASPIALPVYIPQGYERRADVTLHPFTDQPVVTITWESNGKGNINLDIQYCPSQFGDGCGLIVGKNALEEISFKGKPAVVVHGAWNYDTQQYDTSVATAIQWKYDENTVYTISSWNQGLSLDELIKMAESIP